MMIHPKDMTKVRIVGPRSRLGAVVERLHDLGVLHVDEYDAEREDIDIGDPQEDAEELSDLLVRLRSVKSRLPEAEAGADVDTDVAAAIDEVADRLDRIEDELAETRQMQEEKEDLLGLLETVRGLGLDLDAFQDYDRLDIHVGTVRDTAFMDDLPDGRSELHQDGNTVALFVDADLNVEEALRDSGFDRIDVSPLMGRDGDVADEIADVEQTLAHLEGIEQGLEEERAELAAEWGGALEDWEGDLSDELEKAEAPLQFATTDSAFIAEGWLPEERFDEVVAALEDATQGSIHIETEEAGHDAPVAHDNPPGVNPLEDLIGLYGTPKYTEVDPTFLLLTFPLLFGFMLGDIGYGLTTFALFYIGYRKVPSMKGLWLSLMYASVATIAFGLIYAEMFGFVIFGSDSALTAVTGIELFSQIPVLFHRAHELGTVLTLSLLIGIVHVNLGFLVGAYNEYLHHGVMEAVFAKLSWIVIEIGAAVAIVTGNTMVGAGVMVAGVAMLWKGEGIEGLVEIPSLLSNVLSYLRIFGVSIAVVSLALVVNVIAEPLFQSGSILMMLFGVIILVLGHTMNTFIKLMEAGLQGIRLHYVEFFTKFFEGGGTYYKPFGAKEVQTR